MDNLTLSMLFLSFSIFPFLLNSYYKIKKSLLYKINFWMFLFILFFFVSNSMFWMFLFFEIIILPILFMILGWGYQFERLQASFYLIMYTIFFSFPFFSILLYNFLLLKHSSFFFYSLFFYSWLSIFFFLPFFVKLPMVFIHYWLPKAHVEAPTIGSIILAALLLKLGGYGVIRFLDIVMCDSPFIFYLTIFGMVVTTMVCIFQSDTKSTVAYFSVAHMNFMLCCIFLSFFSSKSSSLFMMMAHGFSSGLMFFCMGLFFYYVMSRSIYFNHLSLYFFPFLLFFMCMSILSNFSVPPFINIFPEIVFFSFIFSKNFLLSFFLLLYCMYMIYASLFFLMNFFHGNFSNKKFFQKTFLLFSSSSFFMVFLLLNWKLLLFSFI